MVRNLPPAAWGLMAFAAVVAVGTNVGIARLAALPEPTPSHRPTERAPVPPSLDEAEYLAGILGRNLFDATRNGQGALPVGRIRDPELRLLAVAVATPVELSRALIAWVSSPDLPETCSVGDTIREREVIEIRFDRVALQKDGGPVEFLWLDALPSAVDQAPAGDAGDGVEQTGDGTFAVTRRWLDDALQDVESLSRLARVTPHRGADGAPDGFRLAAIRAESLLGRLGVRNGDVVHSVNGQPLNSVPSAMGALDALRTGSRFCVDLTRRGQPTELCYDVRE